MKTFYEYLLLMEAKYPVGEFMKRLKTFGWTLEQGEGSHMKAKAPDGIGSTTFSLNSWDRSFGNIISDITGPHNQNRYKSLDYLFDLSEKDFKKEMKRLDANKKFDYVNQRIVKSTSTDEETLPVTHLATNHHELINKEIKRGNDWKKVADVDVEENILNVMFADGEMQSFPFVFGKNTTLTFRTA